MLLLDVEVLPHQRRLGRTATHAPAVPRASDSAPGARPAAIRSPSATRHVYTPPVPATGRLRALVHLAPLIGRLLGSCAAFAIAAYWCAALTGPVPALLHVVGDTDALAVTVLLGLAPIALGSLVLLQIARVAPPTLPGRPRVDPSRRRRLTGSGAAHAAGGLVSSIGMPGSVITPAPRLARASNGWRRAVAPLAELDGRRGARRAAR